MRPSDLSRLVRARRDAGSRAFRTAARLENVNDGRPAVAFLVGYESERLLLSLLDASEILVANLHIPQDEYEGADFGELRDRLVALKEALDARDVAGRRSRLIARLADTRGRTPEEAAVYAAKALQLAEAGS